MFGTTDISDLTSLTIEFYDLFELDQFLTITKNKQKYFDSSEFVRLTRLKLPSLSLHFFRVSLSSPKVSK